VLEDYPDTIAQIQAAWRTPIDAMAILEALLFRRDETSELFDLPAYRDVLLMYAISRDLWQQQHVAGGPPVDVLLPMEASSRGSAASSARAGAHGAGGAAATSFEEGDTAGYGLPTLDAVGAGTASQFGDVHATLHLEPQLFDPTRPQLDDGEADEAGGDPDRFRR